MEPGGFELVPLASLAGRWPCSAGRDSVDYTALESDVRSATRGGGGAGLRPAGAAAGQWREMGRAGFEPATLGLRGGRWDLGRSRSSWKTSAFEPITAVRSRWISVELVAPVLPQPHRTDCSLRW